MKAIIVATNHDKLTGGKPTGAYASEIAHPLAVFEACGVSVVFASPAGGDVPLDGPSEDADTRRFIDEHCSGTTLQHTAKLAECEIPDLIFFAGGHGAMWDFPAIGEAPPVALSNARIRGAVCHGVAVFCGANGRGMELSCFTDVEERISETELEVPFLLETALLDYGCIIRKAAPWRECVTVRGSIVTGQNPASARRVAFEMLRLAISVGRAI